MSDQRLRELERRWKEAPSPHTEADYLRERVRAGSLSEARLRLAAFLGHEAAGLAARDPVAPPEPAEARWFLWGRELARLDAEAPVRCAVAIARHLLPELEDDPFADDMARDCLRCAERWALDPWNPELVEAAAQALAFPDEDTAELGFPTPASRQALAAARMAAAAARGRREDSAAAQAALAGQAVLGDAQAVLRILRDEVVPWALGYRDPIAAQLANGEGAGEAPTR